MNPAFINQHRFLSSDYMYRQMTWDPDRVTKRLGDGFYEQELVRQQVAGLTGMRYINGYTDDEEEYKALMDAGIAYAKEYGLKPGISLTKEQMAGLTSDMVWLETTMVTVHGKTYEVLYPKVYLKPETMTLTSDGSLISADTLVAETKKTLENNASILGNTVVLKGNDVVNLGSILGKDIALKAERDITQQGLITGEDRAALTAGRDISMGNTILHGKNQDILNTTAGIAVKGKEGVLLMESGRDIHLTGATLEALGDKGSMILKAGKDFILDTDSLQAKKDMTENRDNYIRTYRKTETSDTLAAGKDIILASGEHVSIRNAVIASKNGAVTAAARGDVTVANGYNEARDDYGLKYKEKGFLSSKTTAIRSHDEEKKASPAIISGDTVSILSGKDTHVSGSRIIANHDVTVAAGGNTTITSTEEREVHDFEKEVRKSGLLGGGDFGFTIGSEKRKDHYEEAVISQKGSLLGSTEGNVSLSSGNAVTIESSDLTAGKNMTVTGKNILVSGKDNVYTTKEDHKYKRSGLTVSLGGNLVSTVDSMTAPFRRSGEVKDRRLSALYDAQGVRNLYDAIGGYMKNVKTIEQMKGDAASTGRLIEATEKEGILPEGMKNDLQGIINRDYIEMAEAKTDNKARRSVAVDVSLGTFKSHYTMENVAAEITGSKLTAGESLEMKADKDLTVKGSSLRADDVYLEAGENIRILSGENRSRTTEKDTSSSASLGAGFGSTGFTGAHGSYSKGKQTVEEEDLTHTGSQIKGTQGVRLESGKDTAIKGSRISGGKITADIGGSLAMESEQDIKRYHEKGKQVGISVGYAPGTGKAAGYASAGRDHMDSDYASVTEQSGIYAGKEGFAVRTGGNTHLKGAVIASEAKEENNSLQTGILSWEDINNRAEYKAGGAGLSYAPKDKNVPLNARGLTPQIRTPAVGKAGSITKSAVAEGHITITGMKKQDISALNRDTKNSLNHLKEIFDSKKLEEKQELIQIMNIVGNQAIHEVSAHYGWKEGSKEKVLLHGALGALTGSMSGKGTWTGALSGSVNEFAVKYIEQTKGIQWVAQHSDVVQGISTVLGAVIGKVTENNGDGSYTLLMGTKWNRLSAIAQGDLNKAFKLEMSSETKNPVELVRLLTTYINMSEAAEYPASQKALHGVWHANTIYTLPEVIVNKPEYKAIDRKLYNEIALKYNLQIKWDDKKSVQGNLEALRYDLEYEISKGRTIFQSNEIQYGEYSLGFLENFYNETRISRWAETASRILTVGDLLTTDNRGKLITGIAGGMVGDLAGKDLISPIIIGYAIQWHIPLLLSGTVDDIALLSSGALESYIAEKMFESKESYIYYIQKLSPTNYDKNEFKQRTQHIFSTED